MKKNLVKYTLEIEVVFQARFKLTRAPIWVLQDLLCSFGAPALWEAKVWFPVLLLFLEGIWQASCGSTFLLCDSAYQHHLPLLRLLKGLGKTYVDSVRPGPQGIEDAQRSGYPWDCLGLHWGLSSLWGVVFPASHYLAALGGPPLPKQKTLPYSTMALSGNFHLRFDKEWKSER